jgi:hypothetical protein
LLVSLALHALLSMAAPLQLAPPRTIVVDVKETAGPVDRFFDPSVGSEYPGMLIRDDSHAPLKTTVAELGFRQRPTKRCEAILMLRFRFLIPMNSNDILLIKLERNHANK